MNRPSNVIPLHRSVAPMPLAHMAHHDPAAAYRLDEEGDYVRRQLEALNRRCPVRSRSCPLWLERCCQAFILAMGVAGLALWMGWPL